MREETPDGETPGFAQTIVPTTDIFLNAQTSLQSTWYATPVKGLLFLARLKFLCKRQGALYTVFSTKWAMFLFPSTTLA